MNVQTYVAPELRSLVEKLRAVRPRLIPPDLTSSPQAEAPPDAGAPEERWQPDPEALHDLRVGLRRLRALLRPLGAVFGKKRVKAARAALKSIGDASSTLRDEEVLDELLRSLTLSPAAEAGLHKWLDQRAAQTKLAREAFLRALQQAGPEEPGGLDAAMHAVEELLDAHGAHHKGGGGSAGKRAAEPVIPFATEVVQEAQRELGDISVKGPDDATGLHDLRIGYKRLRYAIDGFARALPPELLAMREVAIGLQKRLGDLHDLDVALATIDGATGLAKAHRKAVSQALTKKRKKAVHKFAYEAGSRAEGWPEASEPPPVPSHAPLSPPPTGLPSRG